MVVAKVTVVKFKAIMVVVAVAEVVAKKEI